MVEREVKILVSKKSFEKCKCMLNKMVKPLKLIQVNHYFDTKDFMLHTLGDTLRIRHQENSCLLQYKYRKQFFGFDKSCEEYEEIITEFMPTISSMILPIHSTLTSSEQINFTNIGCLTTERMNYLIDDTVVSLDSNFYFGKCDYEVEVEFFDKKKAEDILYHLHLNCYEYSDVGKYSRFVSEYKRIYS